MKVQSIKNLTMIRYILLDDNYKPIDEVNRFLKHLDICGKSPNTLRSYSYHLKLYYEYLASKNIDALELFDNSSIKPVDTLCSFMFWLQYPNSANNSFDLNGEECKRSNTSVNTIMSTILSFYQYLSCNNEISEASTYKIQRANLKYKSFLYEMYHHNTIKYKSILRKPTEPKVIEAINRKQYILMLKNCNCIRDQLLIAIMFEGGLRLSETIGIHKEDLSDIQDGLIKIVPRENNENNARVKNHSAGIIKVPDYVIEMIISYINITDSFDSDYLFLISQGKNAGHPLTADSVEKLFGRLTQKIGFKVTPHMLRHGFATEKLEAGWQLVDIQAYLRHKNLSSTQIYASYSNELKKEKMRLFFDKHASEMEIIANEIKNL